MEIDDEPAGLDAAIVYTVLGDSDNGSPDKVPMLGSNSSPWGSSGRSSTHWDHHLGKRASVLSSQPQRTRIIQNRHNPDLKGSPSPCTQNLRTPVRAYSPEASTQIQGKLFLDDTTHSSEALGSPLNWVVPKHPDIGTIANKRAMVLLGPCAQSPLDPHQPVEVGFTGSKRT